MFNKIIHLDSLFRFLLVFLFLPSFAQEQEALKKIAGKIDSTDHSSTFNAYPFVFYNPEVKFAGGAGGIFIFYTGNEKNLKPSKIDFSGYYTSNNQYKLSTNHSYYFFNNKLYVKFPFAFGYFIDKFWGVGNTTKETGNEEYSKQLISASLTVQLPPLWFSSNMTGLILDYENTKILDKKSNEYLLNDSVTATNGAELFGIGSDFTWDSRDNIFFPNTGSYQYFKIVFYPGINDHVFSFLELEARHFERIRKDFVFAGLFYVSSATGEVPFYKLPALGGKRMRGFFEGRYRDNFYGVIQVELRHMAWKRFGYVIFGGAGDVSHSILDYNLQHVKYNFGGGLRFMFNEKERVNVRADFAFGSGGSHGIYFGLEEAF